ncbi:FMN reductase [Streptomyces sp. NPDC102467]|uniref:FMN reductase n=1 Tax=Streptomyces sp. NPDC102467 TaxID=3366179 RepID=UPI003815E16A
MRLTVVSAGLSTPSSTRLLADRLTEATRSRLTDAGTGSTVEVIELRSLAQDIAARLVSAFPSPALAEALDSVARADALIAVTPVFSASYSGLFKSFFDVLEPDTLTGTPVLLAAAGGTARHSMVLDHALRPLFTFLRAEPVPTAVFAASEDWGGTGDALTDTLPVRIARAGAELAGRLLSGGPGRAAAQAEFIPFAEQLAGLERP